MNLYPEFYPALYSIYSVFHKFVFQERLSLNLVQFLSRTGTWFPCPTFRRSPERKRPKVPSSKLGVCWSSFDQFLWKSDFLFIASQNLVFELWTCECKVEEWVEESVPHKNGCGKAMAQHQKVVCIPSEGKATSMFTFHLHCLCRVVMPCEIIHMLEAKSCRRDMVSRNGVLGGNGKT